MSKVNRVVACVSLQVTLKGIQRDITVPEPRSFVAQCLDLMLFNEVVHMVFLHVDATPWTRTILKHYHINQYTSTLWNTCNKTYIRCADTIYIYTHHDK